MTPEDIENRFTFHPATTVEKQNTHEVVRELCKDLARELNELLPEGRELSLAITKLEECMFFANAAIARHDSAAKYLVPTVGVAVMD